MSKPFPIVSLTNHIDGEFVKRTTQDLFSDKKILLTGLPGAFTPTCSEKHLPQYEAAIQDFLALGIDEVWCTSVNDDFTMDAWFNERGIRYIKPLADGNAHLAAMLNQLVLKNDKGFGLRSWRYAMVVDDMEIIFSTEESDKRDNAEEDPYEKTTPEVVLNFLKQSGGI
jgi:peroxiredoxin